MWWCDGGGNPKSTVRCFRDSEKTGWFGDQRGLSRGVCHPTERTLPRQQLEVQNEDGEKPPPRIRSGFSCGDSRSGSRSSRQGQAGRIREGLQSLRGRILLYARHRSLLEDRRLGSRRGGLGL